MKRNLLLILVLSLLTIGYGIGQNKKSPKAESEAKVGDCSVKINYSSPSVRGRTVWGDLVPYDKVWRTGADNATTVEFSAPVTIEGKPLDAGKYALFTIPGPKEWTIIFNKNPDQWGAYSYDKSQDALRVTAVPKQSDMKEQLSIDLDKEDNLVIAWERLTVEVKVRQSKNE